MKKCRMFELRLLKSNVFISHHVQKLTKMDQRPTCKSQNYLLQENTGANLCYFGFYIGFLDMTSKTQAVNEKNRHIELHQN